MNRIDQPGIRKVQIAGRATHTLPVGGDEHFWFDNSHYMEPARVTEREKYIGVALIGVLTSLVALGYFAAEGLIGDAIPAVTVILFFTALWIGFLLLRVPTPGANVDPKMMGAALSHAEEAAALSDDQGRLLCANAKYRDFFGGRSPSLKRLLFDKTYGQAIRMLLQDALTGKPSGIKVKNQKGDKNVFISVKPEGHYILWTFVEREVGAGPLANVGNMENHFQALLDRFALGLVISDEEGNIRYANPKTLELTGLDGGQIRGQKADSVLGPTLLRKKNLNLDWLDIPGETGRKSKFQFGVVQKFGAMEAGSPSDSSDFTKHLHDAPVAIAVVDLLDFRVEQMNPAFNDLLRKYLGKEIKTGQKLLDVLPEEIGTALKEKGAAAAKTKGKGSNTPVEFNFGADGEDVVQAYFGSVQEGRGRLSILYLIDTSETKRLEMQFVQAQKMQAVGQLAGGVAHDFNNLLTAIIGFCDLLLLRHKPGDQSFADLIQIKQNANRAADLIRQLLTFSRRQAQHPRVLDVAEVVSDLSNLIRRLIGEKIKLRLISGKDVGSIRADQGQFEQVIINMAVNARDAMQKGGTLTIETSHVNANQVSRLNLSGLDERDYVRITISDTGHGISKQHLDKVFEPFFTTKEVGKGTGLGLSTAYGIVTQTGGNIFVTSEEGKGSTFDVFLPALEEEEVAKTRKAAEKETVPKDLTGTEVILFVEDEDPVRTFVARALQNKGYKVLEADSGENALEVLKNYKGPLDLLVSDVVMPNMDGPTLARKVLEKFPEIKIILISGYAEAGFDKGLERDRFEFVPKPFSLQVLAEKVRQVLEEK